MSDLRDKITTALRGHRLNTMSHDSGWHCTCGSDSRFEQVGGDRPWESMSQHRADVLMPVIDGWVEQARADAAEAKVTAILADLKALANEWDAEYRRATLPTPSWYSAELLDLIAKHEGDGS